MVTGSVGGVVGGAVWESVGGTVGSVGAAAGDVVDAAFGTAFSAVFGAVVGSVGVAAVGAVVLTLSATVVVLVSGAAVGISESVDFPASCPLLAIGVSDGGPLHQENHRASCGAACSSFVGAGSFVSASLLTLSPVTSTLVSVATPPLSGDGSTVSCACACVSAGLSPLASLRGSCALAGLEFVTTSVGSELVVLSALGITWAAEGDCLAAWRHAERKLIALTRHRPLGWKRNDGRKCWGRCVGADDGCDICDVRD